MISSIAELLETHGHSVVFFSMQHPEIFLSKYSDYFVPYMEVGNSNKFTTQIRIAGRILYSWKARESLARLLDHFSVDIAHLHSIHHQISPSILGELKKRDIPIIMTLHDYKMVCPSYMMLNRGRICESCKGKRFYNCVRARCHKGSFSKSLLATLESYMHHRILNSYKDIKYYICPSKFLMEKVQYMGLEGQFVHLPNFGFLEEWAQRYNRTEKMVYVPHSETKPNTGDYIAYAGRFSPEKGIETLLSAACKTALPVWLAGEYLPVRKMIERVPSNVRLVGHLDRRRMAEFYRNARFLVVPSICYETFGLVVAEAMSHSLPVIASRIGALPEIVEDSVTGLLFEPGNPEELADKMRLLWENPNLCRQMGKAGRQKVIREYSEDIYYDRLMAIYQKAIEINDAKKR